MFRAKELVTVCALSLLMVALTFAALTGGDAEPPRPLTATVETVPPQTWAALPTPQRDDDTTPAVSPAPLPARPRQPVATPPADPAPTAAEPAPVSVTPAPAQPVASGNPRKLYRIHRVTAYCDRGTTASGRQSGVGQCAAPGDIPFGSKVHIPALGRTFVVTDRTHRRFRHNTVDIFMTSRWSCRQFGVKYLECIIELPPER